MSRDYQEPELSVLVLDFLKPEATRLCLESIQRHIKVPHRTIYLHNGSADYAYQFYQNGLADHFIQTDVNRGLGVGTRDLVAACFSRHFIMLQNDQIVGRDFPMTEFYSIIGMIEAEDVDNKMIGSLSLAGPVGGRGVYSERCHLMETELYRQMEHEIPLSPGGAGPFSHQVWREEQIQNWYRENNYTHYTDWRPLVVDNGHESKRTNPDGSVWRHEPDTKKAWLVSGPVKERYVYPKFTDAEWDRVIETQSWPDGQIPEAEIKNSFVVQAWH